MIKSQRKIILKSSQTKEKSCIQGNPYKSIGGSLNRNFPNWERIKGHIQILKAKNKQTNKQTKSVYRKFYTWQSHPSEIEEKGRLF